MNKAVFIDKDGTLIPDLPYNVDTSLISLQDGAVDGLKLLQSAGFLLIIISNQAGVAYGYFKEADILQVEQKLKELLLPEGIRLDGFFYCPHHPQGKIEGYSIRCSCRKPEAGMIFKAAEKFSLDLSRSWMIGDILNDVEAGHNAGCKSILIDNGNETEWVMNEKRKPDFTAADIKEAALHILNGDTGKLYK
jgi:D-glycero-D-manno-heptose 1,7-bisphosphate phosphatase